MSHRGCLFNTRESFHFSKRRKCVTVLVVNPEKLLSFWNNEWLYLLILWNQQFKKKFDTKVTVFKCHWWFGISGVQDPFPYLFRWDGADSVPTCSPWTHSILIKWPFSPLHEDQMDGCIIQTAYLIIWGLFWTCLYVWIVSIKSSLMHFAYASLLESWILCASTREKNSFFFFFLLLSVCRWRLESHLTL